MSSSRSDEATPNICSDALAEPAVDVRDLVKEFSTATGILVAVNGVSMRVYPGEVYGLLGANGAGKTTTLRMMLGLQRPTSGTVRIAGFDVATQPIEVKRRVSLVSSSSGRISG